MLRPEEMHKVRVTCHQAQLERVIEELYQAKAIHLTQHIKDAERDIGSPLARHEELSRLLLKTRGLLSLLGIEQRKAKPLPAKVLVAAERTIDALTSRATTLTERQHQAEAELVSLKQERQAAALLKGFGISPQQLSASKRLVCFLGTVKEPEELNTKLDALTPRFELQRRSHERGAAILLAIDAALAGQAQSLLAAAGFAETKLPDARQLAPIETLDKRIAAAERSRLEATKGLQRLAAEQAEYFRSLDRALVIATEKTGAPLGFGVTEATAAITGWVPQSHLHPLQKRLEELTNQRLLFEELDIEEDEAGPVKLKNPVLVKPFQALLDLYSLPNSREIDPTLFLFITFPLFFGFMLGDIGYGLLTMALFLVLRKKLPAARDLLNVMIWASLWSIAFGFVYGEFFGFEELGGFALPHLLARSTGVATLITISLLIGIGHLFVGLVLGFLNVWHHHSLSHAVKEKLGWMLLLPGIAKLLIILSLIGGGAGAFLDAALPAVAIILLASVGVILIVLGEGVKGVIELPGIFSNVLSYTRLMALGIASVSLAIVINQFTAQYAVQGGAGLIVAVLIFTIGHAINIALGLIGPFLHSLRLHYVELFAKFFEGGGEEFHPFGAETEE